MAKKYFVLKEDLECDNYPTLVRLKDYCKKSGESNPNSVQLTKELLDKGYQKIETDTNIILTHLGV